MKATRKQIAFDLDTDALKKYYPSDSWQNAYDVIKRHMKQNHFSWLQGSVYVSEKNMTSYRVAKILKDLVAKNPWLNRCMRDCRETDIGNAHDKNYIFDKDADIPTREEMKANKGQDTASRDQEKTMSLSDYKKLISDAKGLAGNIPSEPRNGHTKNDGRGER